MSSDRDAKYRLWQARQLGEEEYNIAYGSYLHQKNKQMRKHKEETYKETIEEVVITKKKRKE